MSHFYNDVETFATFGYEMRRVRVDTDA